MYAITLTLITNIVIEAERNCHVGSALIKRGKVQPSEIPRPATELLHIHMKRDTVACSINDGGTQRRCYEALIDDLDAEVSRIAAFRLER
ncbi:hypothetical protein SPHV1_1120005 [Novosphingobium sp. KN65.2]|nr:hypothetical protein SPHV1_1120005 [Novosphingobium sp. KN65.2]